MAKYEQALRVYEQLAVCYESQGQAKLRDWFLVLAADTALSAGQTDAAEAFRLRLLQLNPHHLLKPYASFAEAMQSKDIKGYVADLRVTYPPGVAADLLQSQAATANDVGREHSEAALPARVVGTRPQPSAPSAAETELKVYRVSAATSQSEPLARQPSLPPTRPAPAQALPESTWLPPPVAPSMPTLAVSRPMPHRPVAALEPVLPRTTLAAPTTDPDTATGAWVSTLLFVLVLLLSLGWTVYAFVRPFVEWLR